MFKQNLYNILDDLSNHKRDKSKLLAYYIEKRLNASLATYYKDLSHSCDYLKSKDDVKVMKAMNKVEE